MVVTARTSSVANRELIIALAAHYKMPTFYFEPSLPPPEDLSHTGLISAITIAAQLPTSIVSSKARSLPTCRYKRRTDINWQLENCEGAGP
jgi:hypothetical protein